MKNKKNEIILQRRKRMLASSSHTSIEWGLKQGGVIYLEWLEFFCKKQFVTVF